VAYSRRTGASATVLASLYTRYMQHLLGTRRDEPAARLIRAMPSVWQPGLRLITAPSDAAHRLTGYVPRLYRYPYPGDPPMIHQSAARTTFYDEAVERYLPRVEQLVILGAGFDTRAYRLPEDTRVRCFEIDEPTTQAFKREVLRKAGIDTSRVTFVPADFEEHDWLQRLVEEGFDPAKRTFFTWESVSMYLDRASVEATLRKVASSAPGSAIAFDYMSSEMIHGGSLFWRYGRAVINAAGEPWKFGIDNTPPVRRRVAEFLAGCGLELAEQRNFGPETERERAPAGFAIGVVPERTASH
jgi:methyltransferase (TIGR00027 family)